MTKTTATLLLSALCFAPILTACDEPEDDIEAEKARHPRPVQVGDGFEITTPETDPVGIYGDDAPGPGGGTEPPEPKLPDLVIGTNFSVFPAGGYWYAQFQVKNVGTLKAPASKAAVLLMDDWNNPDPSGYHTGITPEILPGATASMSIKFATMYDTVAGYDQIGGEPNAIWNYKLRHTADYYKVVAESSEINNSKVIDW